MRWRFQCSAGWEEGTSSGVQFYGQPLLEWSLLRLSRGELSDAGLCSDGVSHCPDGVYHCSEMECRVEMGCSQSPGGVSPCVEAWFVLGRQGRPRFIVICVRNLTAPSPCIYLFSLCGRLCLSSTGWWFPSSPSLFSRRRSFYHHPAASLLARNDIRQQVRVSSLANCQLPHRIRLWTLTGGMVRRHPGSFSLQAHHFVCVANWRSYVPWFMGPVFCNNLWIMHW